MIFHSNFPHQGLRVGVLWWSRRDLNHVFYFLAFQVSCLLENAKTSQINSKRRRFISFFKNEGSNVWNLHFRSAENLLWWTTFVWWTMTNYNYSFLKLVNMTFFFETRDIDWKKTRIIVITDKFNSKRYISPQSLYMCFSSNGMTNMNFKNSLCKKKKNRSPLKGAVMVLMRCLYILLLISMRLIF